MTDSIGEACARMAQAIVSRRGRNPAMRNVHATFAASALAFSLSGCYVASFFVPVAKTPADHAHELDKKCRGLSDPGSLALLIPDSAIDAVQPAYSHVVDPPADHLSGAKILVRPWQGLSKESLTRSLECHEASVVLGKAPVIENDPYTLPERWVGIDVESEGDAFLVLVRIDAFKDAERVLARAKSYLDVVRRQASPAPTVTISGASPGATTRDPPTVIPAPPLQVPPSSATTSPVPVSPESI
jgi:hypothetical protein